MFRVQDNVPDVYIAESRDFQLLSRLYDLAFQCARFSIDSMEQASDTMRCNDALLPLIATKIGFFANLKLASNSDRKILSAFPYIIKYKGSIQAIELVTNLFEQLMNTSVYTRTYADDKNRITIVFKDYTKHVELLYYLIEYVRPTGLIIDYTVERQLPVSLDVDYITVDNITIYNISEKQGNGNIQQCKTTTSEAVTNKADTNTKTGEFISTIGFTQVSQVELKSNEESSNEN